MASAHASFRQIDVYTITGTSTAEDGDNEGQINTAFAGCEADMAVLPEAPNRGEEVQLSPPSLLHSPDMGLGEPAVLVDSTADSSSTVCFSHKAHGLQRSVPATHLCIDCLVLCCQVCTQSHHLDHKLAEICASSDNDGDPSSALEQLLCSDGVRVNITNLRIQIETHCDSLVREDNHISQQLDQGLALINDDFHVLLNRINDMKLSAEAKLRSVVEKERQRVKARRVEAERRVAVLDRLIDARANGMRENMSLCDILAAVQPSSLTTPYVTINQMTNIADIALPDVTISADVIERYHPSLRPSTKADVTYITSVGSKGEGTMQFKLPAGLCMDGDQFTYVADEGNNRIQKISSSKECSGSFTWAQDSHLITDVTYNPVRGQLVIPKAYSEKGMLRCCTFSYVTLGGVEVSRLQVKDMTSGLYVSFDAEQGHLLIADTVKRSVFIIKDGEVIQEIISDKYLMQPTRAVAGLDGQVLVADSHRCVVAVFSKEGHHLRDIGGEAGEGRLKKPKGIALDKCCAVVAVTDWSSGCVCLFSYDGALLNKVTGFKCPHSVLLTDNHRMLVTDCWNSEVKVFSYNVAQSLVSTRM